MAPRIEMRRGRFELRGGDAPLAELVPHGTSDGRIWWWRENDRQALDALGELVWSGKAIAVGPQPPDDEMMPLWQAVARAEQRSRARFVSQQLKSRTSIDPKVLGGALVFANSRLPVQAIAARLKLEPREQILNDYPYLTKIDLDFASAVDDLLKRAPCLNARCYSACRCSVMTRLLPHQKIASLLIQALPGVALFMEQGTGKTLAVIAALDSLAADGMTTPRTLVVAPLSVLGEWRRQLQEHRGISSVILSTKTKAKIGVAKIALVNYESAWRMLDDLLEWAPQVVVADESHRIKGPSSRQSKALHKLGDQAEKRVALTGTPIAKWPLDLWSQMRFVEPSALGSSYSKFVKKHGVRGGYGGFSIVGVTGTPEILEKVKPYAYVVSKAEALSLPPTQDVLLTTPLEGEQRRAYDQMKKELLVELDGETITAANGAVKAMRLQQIAGGWIGSGTEAKLVGKAKLALLRDLADDLIEGNRHFTVFARHLAEVRGIASELKAAGAHVLTLSGSTPAEERIKRVAVFQTLKQGEGPSTAFVLQVQSGGVGITLTAADVAIIYSTTWSLIDLEQLKARLHRIGQERPVTYYHLAASKTIDEAIRRRLKEKKDCSDLTIADLRAAVQEEDR